MNFQFVCFLDTHELAASLRQRMGLFDDHEPPILLIRKAEVSKWPELKAMLARISRIGDQGGGIEFGRTFMQMLMPGQTLPWATSEDNGYATAHLALRTNPGAMLYAGTESIHLGPGYLTIVNRRVPGCAINLGEWPRIHLVCDFRRKEPAAPP